MSSGASLLRYLPPDFDFSQINFTDPANRKSTIYAVNIVCLSLSIVFVSLRLCSRLLVVRKIGLDDVLIVLSLILAAALSAVVICATRYYGLGKHVWTLPLQNISTTVRALTKLFYVIAILYTASLTAVKLSILAFYLIKLCPPSINLRYSSFRILTISLMVLVGLLFVISTFVTIFQCRPVNAAWNFALPNRQCIEITHFYYAQNGINIFTDIAIYILPIPMLWKMMLPIRQRIIVCTVMGIGAFVCIASILRLHYLVTEVGESIDLTWVMVNVANYSVLEAHIGIFCASIPSIKPLVMHVFPRLLGTLNRSNTNRSQGIIENNYKNSNNSDHSNNNNPKNNKNHINNVNNNHNNNNPHNVHHRKESWMARAPGESVIDPNAAPMRIPTAEDIEMARQKGRKNSRGEIRDPYESLLNSPPPVEPETGRRTFFGDIGKRLSSAAWLRGGSIPIREEVDTPTATATTVVPPKRKSRPPSLRISIPKQLRILGIGQPSGEAVDLQKYSIKTKSPPPIPPPPALRSRNNSVTNAFGNIKRKNSNTPLSAIGSRPSEDEARIISPTTSPLSPSTKSYATSTTMISPIQPSNSSRVNASSPLPTFNLVSGAIIGPSDSENNVADNVPVGHPYWHVYNNNSSSKIDTHGTSTTATATASGANGGSEPSSSNPRSISPAANIAGIRDSKEQEKAFRQLLLSASRVPEISEVSSESDSEKEK